MELKKTSKRLLSVGSAASIGVEIFAAVVIGALIGQWLDKKLGTSPWLFFLFVCFGIAAGARALVRLNRELHAEAKRQQAEEGEPPAADDQWQEDSHHGEDE